MNKSCSPVLYYNGWYRFPVVATSDFAHPRAHVLPHCDSDKLPNLKHYRYSTSNYFNSILFFISSSLVCGTVAEYQTLTLAAKVGYVISQIVFASYGSPVGTCGSFQRTIGCDFLNSTKVVSSACLGKTTCSILASNTVFGQDPCRSVVKTLSVQADSVLISGYMGVRLLITDLCLIYFLLAYPTPSPFKGPTTLPTLAPTSRNTGKAIW